VRERAVGHFSHSGRIAAWGADSTMRERAVGHFSFSGQIAAWRTDRTVRERVVGRFSYSDRISVMNRFDQGINFAITVIILSLCSLRIVFMFPLQE
jgi:hypothetical protein